MKEPSCEECDEPITSCSCLDGPVFRSEIIQDHKFDELVPYGEESINYWRKRNERVAQD